MKKAEVHHIDILGELLNEITPRERKRTANRMRLAAKIADGLAAKGWSKQKLAEELGYKSSSIVTKWLSGTNNFTSDLLSDIQDVLDIKLLSLEETKEAQQKEVFEIKHVIVQLNPVSQESVRSPWTQNDIDQIHVSSGDMVN